MSSAKWRPFCPGGDELTHWGWVTHICVRKLAIIGSDDGLSPGWCQAIIWINAGILLTGLLGTNVSEILIEILIFLLKKMHLNVSSAKWGPFSFGLNVLKLSDILTQEPWTFWISQLSDFLSSFHHSLFRVSPSPSCPQGLFYFNPNHYIPISPS